MARRRLDISAGLNAPRWLWSLGLALAGTVAVCWPVWPGYASYDSLLAYDQAVGGVTTAIWPPMHAYLFAASRAVGAGMGGVLVLQTFALLLGAFLMVNVLTARTAVAVALCLAFAATFVWVPPQLGTLLAQWRDVTTTSFALLALGVWLAAAQRRFLPGVILAALLFGVAASLRHNSIILIGPPLLLMVWRPYLTAGAGVWSRLAVALAAVIGLGGAWASTHWRLPDLKPLPAARNLVITQQFDLIGISACADRAWLPPAMTAGQPITPDEVRELYDPRHLNMSLGGPAATAGGRPPSSHTLIRIKPGDPAAASVGPAWRAAVLAEPGCYLRHRLTVFREQMGLAPGHVFYPVHGSVDANKYGLALSHPDASQKLVDYVLAHAPEPARRPVWLYVLALAGAALACWRAPAHRSLLVAGLLGALGYVGTLLVAGPATDARYIFPANTLCAVLGLAALGAVVSSADRRSRKLA